MALNELPASVQAWRRAGDFFETDGLRIYFQTRNADKADLPWLLCFHGFPTSSWDWHLLLPLLENHWRVLLFDFPGYGLSDKPANRDYSLLKQLDVAEALLRYLQISRFDLLAHDMGNSVACELLFRREQGNYPFELNSLVLLNGGVYMDLHQPLLTQRLLRTPILGPITARLSSWRVFRLQYPKVYAHPEQFDELHYQEQWSLMLHNQGRRVLSRIASYMKERVRMGERWTGPLHSLDRPCSLIWGLKDPVAVPAIADRIMANNSHAQLCALPDAGHYPQLEAPQAVVKQLLGHLERISGPAAPS